VAWGGGNPVGIRDARDVSVPRIDPVARRRFSLSWCLLEFD